MGKLQLTIAYVVDGFGNSGQATEVVKMWRCARPSLVEKDVLDQAVNNSSNLAMPEFDDNFNRQELKDG